MPVTSVNRSDQARRSFAQLMGVIVVATMIAAMAADTEPVGESVDLDPPSAHMDTAYHAYFKNATLLKVERKARDSGLGTVLTPDILSFPLANLNEKSATVYKLTLSDPLNKKFEVIFDLNGELLATEKYKTTLDTLPKNVQADVEKQLPTTAGSSEAVDVRLDKGVYHVSGKINGRKVNVESALPPSQPANPTPPYVAKQPPVIEPDSREIAAGNNEPVPLKSGKPEIAANVDGPFRARFCDATILSVDRKEGTNVTVHVFAIGNGGIHYDVTLSDPLNKKFKVVFADNGQLLAATKFVTPIDRLPKEVQRAIEKLTPLNDRNLTVEVKIEHKSSPQEHEDYKVSGKINGIKIDVEVPVNVSR